MTPPAVGDTLWQMLPSPDFGTLQAFLEDPSRPAGTLRYHGLQGFLFAVASAPEVVLPSEWQPIIFGAVDTFASLDEAQEILGQITALYSSINAAVRDAPTLLPADCPLPDDVLANFEDEAPIAQWCRGFLRGHRWLEELWEEYLPEELAEELDATLITLAFFSSREMAEAFLAKNPTGEQSLETAAATIHGVLPRAVVQYAHLGRSIATLAEHDAEPSEPSHSTKVGRNAPCPCGSGKKYKKCCGTTTVH